MEYNSTFKKKLILQYETTKPCSFQKKINNIWALTKINTSNALFPLSLINTYKVNYYYVRIFQVRKQG